MVRNLRKSMNKIFSHLSYHIVNILSSMKTLTLSARALPSLFLLHSQLFFIYPHSETLTECLKCLKIFILKKERHQGERGGVDGISLEGK